MTMAILPVLPVHFRNVPDFLRLGEDHPFHQLPVSTCGSVSGDFNDSLKFFLFHRFFPEWANRWAGPDKLNDLRLSDIQFYIER